MDVGPLSKADCCHNDRWNSRNRDTTHRKNSCTCTHCTAVATVALSLAPLQLLTYTCKVASSIPLSLLPSFTFFSIDSTLHRGGYRQHFCGRCPCGAGVPLTYLGSLDGSVISADGTLESELETRIGKAHGAFSKLCRVWFNRNIRTSTIIRGEIKIFCHNREINLNKGFSTGM